MRECEIGNFPTCSFQFQEALNTLATNLTFAGADIKKILITSCNASEGKSLICMNLLRTIAQLGHKVILVDADLRQSQNNQSYDIVFKKEEGEGLAHYLAGRCEAEDIQYGTNIPNAFYVPIGRMVSNAVHLMGSDRLGMILDSFAQSYDYVLVDTPPVGLVIDAAQAARRCDGTLLVVQFDKVSRSKLRSVSNQLAAAGSPVLGTVLNNVPAEGIEAGYYFGRYYGYGYGYGYGIGKKRKKGFFGKKKEKQEDENPDTRP
ncbi:MAG: CpsD/CapB family tyrosine-protein kinase [Blautia sp.]|nr:CpsD/CapB family tyrosine-protein kinase [Blautia sp.]